MTRENAVLVDMNDTIELHYVEDVIRYLMMCHRKGLNVYFDYNGELLYSCDGYTFDEYYLLAMGITPQDKEHLDSLVYKGDRQQEDLIKLSEMTLPIFVYLKEMYKPKRDELRNGSQGKKLS